MGKIRDITTIGFALFAMFFGAGNLLLPPFIGLQIGSHVWVTILAFGLTGILLPFLGILSVTNSGNDFNDLGHRISKNLTAILGAIIMICIGPLIATPRTAATTYEVGVLPFFPESDPIWTSIIFFCIVWLLAITPTKVVDIVGSFLTPILLVILTVLVVLGLTNPIAPTEETALSGSTSFTLGFVEGYQTLDVLASVIFAGIIIAATRAKGYSSVAEKNKIVISAGILAAIFLFFIYGGLIYLGATSGIENNDISRSALLLHIANSHLGQYGTVAIAVSIGLACLTTAIALTTGVGFFFTKLTKGKLSYKLLVTLTCIIAGILSVTGVDNIIQFAYPPLAFVYPIVITLVLYIVIFGRLVKSKLPYALALVASTIIATLNVMKIVDILHADILAWLTHIPFFAYELGWVIPSLIFFVVGVLIGWIKNPTVPSSRA
ncbi:branched-chain amino acid transport system II carrier protein [Sphingobacterium haloxyli]|uniref:Branched-chain amino acid transport system II carrier protein n=1 Tax=Sphingobacterium haloxyli TaxID=2100533 RepID=A0A2S9J8J6_9SPHI|nr:branched-chain amino acid transport system II carrier protein [Sphingobacterium haloxyli]PRD49108.1 branched-chain amino acid transport system II carrier protein [Sphingobacterium haloxyli]